MAVSAELATLQAEDLEVFTFEQAVNVLGFQPGLSELNKYLEECGLLYVAHMTWKRPGAVINRSGHEPTPRELAETRGEGVSLRSIWPQSGRGRRAL